MSSDTTPNAFGADANGEEETQLIPLLKFCYRQFVNNWKWFVLSIAVCLAGGWLYLRTRERVFQRQAVMLIEDSDGGGSSLPTKRVSRRGNMTSLLELNGVSVGDNLKNEIFILSSQRLMNRVVEKLGLEVDYTARHKMRNVPLYGKERPIEVLFQQPAVRGAVSFKVERAGGNKLRLTDVRDAFGNKLPGATVRLGEMTKTAAGKLCVVRGPSYDHWEDGEVCVRHMTREGAVARYCGEMSVSEYDKESSLIVLTCQDMSPKRAEDILSTLYDSYKEDVVENKNRVAESTARFIEDRIALIGRELSEVEDKLAAFKKKNQLLDFDKTSAAVITETSAARQQSLAAETQLRVAQFVGDYIADNANSHDLIPALNIGDPSFTQQVGAYNDAMNKRNTLAANSSESQAVVRDLDRQLQQMRASINSSLRSYIKTLQLRVADARANESQLTGRVNTAPDQEKSGLDIQRQQSLKEALYTYLLNKREEVALQQAINEANVRLVEGPTGGPRPVVPRGGVIMLVALLLGIAIPSAVVWLVIASDVTVHGRHDLEKATTMPILGEIPRMSDNVPGKIITGMHSDAPLVEAFRILRFSLGFIPGDPRVLLTTSSTPGQGKSFVARNMAVILAMAGHKVVMVDGDIRKRTLSKRFASGHGLTSYIAGDADDVSAFIRKDGLAKGVDLLPAGPQPPNPTELLMSPRLAEVFAQLRKTYDYVLVDGTPYFSIADASVLDKFADLTIFVVRAGRERRDFLPKLERMYQEKRLTHICTVVNDADVKLSRYGGGCGYGYGYGYGSESFKEDGRKGGLAGKLRKLFGL